MNILEQQDVLKSLPDDRLMQMMQRPDGTFPQFLIGGELKRREGMRNAHQAQSAKPRTTVAQDLTAPQDAGLGGVVQMANGRFPIGRVSPRYPNPNRVPPINMPRQFLVRGPMQLDPGMQDPATPYTSMDRMHFMRRLQEARTPPPLNRPGPASSAYASELGDIPFIDRQSIARADIAEGDYGTTADPLDVARIREWEKARSEGPYTPPSSTAGYADARIRAGRYGSIDGEQPQTTPVPVPVDRAGQIAANLRLGASNRGVYDYGSIDGEQPPTTPVPGAGLPYPPELGVRGGIPAALPNSVPARPGPGVNYPGELGSVPEKSWWEKVKSAVTDVDPFSAEHARVAGAKADRQAAKRLRSRPNVYTGMDPTPLEVEKAIIEARATQDDIHVPKEGAPKKPKTQDQPPANKTQGQPPTEKAQKLAEDQAALLEAERKAIEGEPEDGESREDLVARLQRQFASGSFEDQRTNYFKGIEEKLAALQGEEKDNYGLHLLRAGLGMAQAGGKGASTAAAIGEGGLAGLDSFEKQRAASKKDALKMLGIEAEIAGVKSGEELAHRKIGLQQMEIELDADRATRQLNQKGKELGINERLVNAKIRDLNKPDTYKWYMSLSPEQRAIVNPILRKSTPSLADEIGKGALKLIDNLEWRGDFEREFEAKNKRKPTMNDILTAARSQSNEIFTGARGAPPDPATIMSKGK